jgi:hypothetical protein
MSEELLDELHIKFHFACKLKNLNFIQRSALPEGMRTFIVFSGNKRAKIVIVDHRFPAVTGDVTLTTDSVDTTPEFIGAAILAALR